MTNNGIYTAIEGIIGGVHFYVNRIFHPAVILKINFGASKL